MKKYANAAIVYAVLALAAGVFYREFTKMTGFEGVTPLGTLHVHFFALGTLFMLVMLGLVRLFGDKLQPGAALAIYHIGLCATAVMLGVRGVLDVLGIELAKGLSAAVSGMAGLSHIALGVGIVLVLLSIRKAAIASEG